MNILDPTAIIKTGGYVAIFAIIFAETGVLIGFFLPGDSLLFSAGFLASAGYLHVGMLIAVSFAAAVLGDTVGYWLGKKYGHKVFARQQSLFFHKDHIVKAEAFYKTHGGKTIILARFLPVLRTMAPMVAGVANMEYKVFLAYNLIGAAVWTGSVSLIGYYLAKVIPHPDHYIIPLILVIVIVSVVPSVIAVLRDKEGRAKAKSLLKQLFHIH